MIPSNGDVFFDRWIPAACAYVVFIIFGNGRDATKIYCGFLNFLGLGRCFPGLTVLPTITGSTPSNSTRGLGESVGGKAKLFFQRR